MKTHSIQYKDSQHRTFPQKSSQPYKECGKKWASSTNTDLIDRDVSKHCFKIVHS